MVISLIFYPYRGCLIRVRSVLLFSAALLCGHPEAECNQHLTSEALSPSPYMSITTHRLV